MGSALLQSAGPLLCSVLWLTGGGSAPASGLSDGQPNRRIVYAEDSAVGRVYVVDEGDLRYLRFDRPDGDDQSVISRSDPAAVPMDYIRLALAGLAHADRLRRVLMIGLGAGTFTTAIYRVVPKVELDAVEISPVVVRVARKWFGLPRSARYRVHVGSGEAYLRKATRRWDVIFLDAYTGDAEPDLMHEQAAFRSVQARLAPGGVALLNLAVDKPVETRMLASFAAVFGTLTCLESSDGLNLLAIGRRDQKRLDPAEVLARTERLARSGPWSFDLVGVARSGFACPRASAP